MSANKLQPKQEIIKQIVSLVKSKLPDDKAVKVIPFIEHYFRNVDYNDLKERKIEDLYGSVLSHWNFFAKRDPNQTKVRVFNPQHAEHGWQSKHTVVEIVHTDMPFLVDSIRMELNRHGMTIHLIISSGCIQVKRDAEGELQEILPINQQKTKKYKNEVVICAEVDQQCQDDILVKMQDNLLRILADVTASVTDWQKMRAKALEICHELEQTPPPIDEKDLKESLDFIRWISDDRFTFLGYREYEMTGQGSQQALTVVKNSGLGLLRDDSLHHPVRLITDMTQKAREKTLSTELLITAKLNSRATVHRPAFIDFVGIKRFDSRGNVVGECRFIGLYTSIAYHSSPTQIPILRRKVDYVLARSNFDPKGHAGKELVNVLESYPRDELFQATNEQLFETALGILHLQERRKTRLFVRADTYGRFFSCLVYVPKDRFNSQIREHMGFILLRELGGQEVNFSTRFSESVLMRIHFIIRLAPDAPMPEYNVQDIEKKLTQAGRIWQDDLKDALMEQYGEDKGNRYFHKYQSSFPAGYQEQFDGRTAVFDIGHMESIQGSESLPMSFYRPLEEANGLLYFKLFSAGETMVLSDVLPMLENMGFRVISERMFNIRVNKNTCYWIHDFGMFHQQGNEVEVENIRHTFEQAFLKVWARDIENDDFNRLVISAKLDWHQVVILRAYAKYFRQIGFTYSQALVAETLNKYPDIANKLIHYFYTKFDPATPKNDAQLSEAEEKIHEVLEHVSGLDEDRILHQYLRVMIATKRTNYFQKNEHGENKLYVSFKLDPSLIPDMPLPLPQFEIFVYSPRVEGVHLRGGKVARGGLRWSDRREDFRTEVLGLMKAQQVKNSVIVPSGAKGGFVPQHLPESGDRDEIMQEVTFCYKRFISGLLDITDNLQGTAVIPAKDCVRYDDDDPYLVVAADKGTATFSDIANEIANQYGFWLGDAFASGGSVGYDHKKMGITARGAWESVKRHFRELGKDIQATDFTVVGIGDMAGDVFGNGMLLSRHILLVAAFNHQHIFIDPTPDAEVSYGERERLFHLPRSSWADYNTKLISEGGGIYKRSAKSIKLTPQIKKLLDIKADQLVPNDLIMYILKAKADLLFNGGIGTYVKGSSESHAQVGDRANDCLRIDGQQLRVKVVGEGGNLGLTQLGRVEFSLNGGICYSDFIDNSAGVDCSDHEVNLKILLNRIVESKDMTDKQRNELLERLTDDVAKLVLTNNYRQTGAISYAAMRAPYIVDEYIRFMEELERDGKLNRSLEFLPSNDELAERKAKAIGLTRPEISVLIAYSKNVLKEALLCTPLMDEPFLFKFLAMAFPAAISEQFAEEMKHHRLRREIIATQVASLMSDEMGTTFYRRLYDETGATPEEVAKAFIVTREIFDLPGVFSQIDNLNNKVDTAVQLKMMGKTIRLVRRSCRWFLRNHRGIGSLEDTINHFKPLVESLFKSLPNILRAAAADDIKQIATEYEEAGVPKNLAMRIAASRPMVSALDIVEAATLNKLPLEDVGELYFLIGNELELSWFRELISNHPVSNNWEALARAMSRDDLDRQQRAITEGILKYQGQCEDLITCLAQWKKDEVILIKRWQSMLAELKASPTLSFTMFSVALRELVDIAEASNACVEKNS